MEVCRLCLELLQGNNFKRLEDCKSIIKNLIPKLKFDLTFQPVICNQCSTSVDESNKFKTLCLESQQQLKQKLKGKDKSMLTATEILHGSSIDKVIDRGNERICQTCLESIECESFTILNPSNPDAYLDSMLTMCLSELDLRISQNPVMCEKCLNSLQKFYHFKTTCLDVEEKLKRYLTSHGTIAKSPISLFKVLDSLQASVKTDLKFNTLMDVQAEKLAIKTEKQDDIIINNEQPKNVNISSSVQDYMKLELKLTNIAADNLDIKIEKQDDEPKDMDICQEELDIKLEEFDKKKVAPNLATITAQRLLGILLSSPSETAMEKTIRMWYIKLIN